MPLLVYELTTAQGHHADPASPLHSLWLEGRAMRDALAADFAAGVVTPAELPHFRELALAANRVVVIAPELGGELASTVAQVRDWGANCWNCSAETLALASDKLALAEHWRRRGVPTPEVLPAPASGADWPAFACVGKPRDGAGSSATALVRSPADWQVLRARAGAEGIDPATLILTRHHPGTAASVAFLADDARLLTLPPGEQHVTADGCFAYTGGTIPLPAPLAARAEALAARALSGIGGLLGWVGVDLILADDPSGRNDAALEINPRLTTSYLGYRKLCAGNLAEAWARWERGGAGPRWRSGRVSFTPSG